MKKKKQTAFGKLNLLRNDKISNTNKIRIGLIVFRKIMRVIEN